MIIFGGRAAIAETNAPCRPSRLALAAEAVCLGEGSEERQGLVPGVAPAVAWVLEPGSYNQGPEGLGKGGRHHRFDQEGAGDAPV